MVWPGGEQLEAEKDVVVLVTSDLKPSQQSSSAVGQWCSWTDQQSSQLQRQEALHPALQGVCQASSGVLCSGLVTLPEGRHGEVREVPEEGGEHGGRVKE